MQKQEDVQAGRWEIMFESLFRETRLSAGDVSSRDGMGWDGVAAWTWLGYSLQTQGFFFLLDLGQNGCAGQSVTFTLGTWT